MRRTDTPQYIVNCDLPPNSLARAPLPESPLPPLSRFARFAFRALCLGVPTAAVIPLYSRVRQTGDDVRAGRITRAGGIARVERLALAVAAAPPVVGGAA